MSEGSTVSVIARIRPLKGNLTNEVLNLDGEDSILVNSSQRYTFTRCLGPETRQETVFEVAGRGISDAALSGYNCTLFAYGQTGSGKTHTIYGPSDGKDVSQQGLLPRTLEYVFTQMRAKEESSGGRLKYSVKVSFLEVGVFSLSLSLPLTLPPSRTLTPPSRYPPTTHPTPPKDIQRANL